MYDLIIIGAGPGGIALAAEARASGIDSSRTLILEKGATHNWAIRQLYPQQKLTTANYKGFEARCEGLLCITDMTKSETLDFFDKVIETYEINIQFNAEVYAAHRVDVGGMRVGDRRLGSYGSHFQIAGSKNRSCRLIRGCNSDADNRQ